MLTQRDGEGTGGGAKTLPAVLAVTSLLVGALSGAFVLWAAMRARAIDATPREAMSLRPGTEVWLRGMRDREHPIRGADGQMLYPVESEPGLLVECGAERCAGPLVGRVERLTLHDVSPDAARPLAGRALRVVRVGRWGDERQERVRIGAWVGAGSIALGVALVGFLLLAIHRRRRHA